MISVLLFCLAEIIILKVKVSCAKGAQGYKKFDFGHGEATS